MTAIGMSHPPRVHRRVGGQRTALTAGIGLLLAALVLTTIANPPAAFAHTAQLSTATPAPAVAATDANDVPTWPFRRDRGGGCRGCIVGRSARALTNQPR